MSYSSTFSLRFSGSISNDLMGAFRRLKTAGKDLNSELTDLNKATRDIGQYRKASDQMSKFKEQMKLGGKNAVALRKNLAEVSKQVKAAEQDYAGLQKQLKEIDRQRRRSRLSGRRSIDERTDAKLARERARVASRMERSQARQDKLAAERREVQERLTAGKDKATARYAAQAAKVRELSQALHQAGYNADKLDTSEKRLARSMAAANTRLHHRNRADYYRERRQNAFGSSFGIAAAGAAGAMPVKWALDYKDQLAEATKTFNTIETDQQAWRFGLDNLRQSIMTPMISHAEMLEISGTGGKLGVAEKDIADFRKKVAMAKATWDMTANDSAESMAKISNSFRIPMANLTDIMDLINHYGNTYKAQERDIADALGRSAGVFRTVGFDEFTSAASVNTMIHLGKESEVAARMFNTTLIKLQTISQQSDKAVTAFERLGWKSDEFEAMWAQDAQGTFLKFLQRLSKQSSLDRSKILAPLMGAEWTDDYLLLVNGLEDYEKALQTAGDRKQWVGAVTREYIKRIDTEKSALGLLKKQVTAIGIVTGAVALPTIKEFAKTTGEGLVKVFDYAEKNPEAIKKIFGGSAAVLGGVAGWKALAGSTRLVTGSLGEMYHTLKSISALNIMKKRYLGLGALGIAAYAAHELGMLEPMAKGFTSELKKGSKGLLDEVNEAIHGWNDILDGKSIRDMANWEDIGKTIGETAGEHLVKSLEFWVDFGKWIGNVAAAISLKDWKQLRALTTKPINEAAEGALYDSLGSQEYLRRKNDEAIQRIKKQKGEYDSGALKNFEKSTFGNLINVWTSTFSPFPEQMLKSAEKHKNNATGLWDKISNSTIKQLSDTWVSTYSPYGPHPLKQTNPAADGASVWGNLFSRAYDFLKEKNQQNIKEAREMGVKQMSIFPMGESKNFDDILKTTAQVKDNVNNMLGDARKAAERFGKLGLFDNMLSNIQDVSGNISKELDETEERFEGFRSGIIKISADIAGHFGSIGSGIRGSITSELSAATSEAHKLANAIKNIDAQKLKSSPGKPVSSTSSLSDAEIMKYKKEVYDTVEDIGYGYRNQYGTDDWVRLDLAGIETPGLEALGRASGGPMSSGRPYLVGERGPELVFPSRPGWVMNNGLTRGLFGGLHRALFGGFGGWMPGLSFGLSGGSLSGLLLGGLLNQFQASRKQGNAEIDQFLKNHSRITQIRNNQAGGTTVKITVNIPPGVSNADQVRDAAHRGASHAWSEFEKRFQQMTHEQQRTAFGY